MRDERIRLFLGVVLPEGRKKDVLRVQKRADVPAGGAERVVRRQREDDRHFDAQAGLDRHRDARVRHGVRDFRCGVPGARHDDQRVRQMLRADRLRPGDRVDDLPPADLADAAAEALRRAEACVRIVSRFAHHRQDFIRLSQPCELLQRVFERAEGTAQGKCNGTHHAITTPQAYCKRLP